MNEKGRWLPTCLGLRKAELIPDLDFCGSEDTVREGALDLHFHRTSGDCREEITVGQVRIMASSNLNVRRQRDTDWSTRSREPVGLGCR